MFSPLKLRNTLCVHLGVEEEEEDGNDEVKAMREMNELEPWVHLVYKLKIVGMTKQLLCFHTI